MTVRTEPPRVQIDMVSILRGAACIASCLALLAAVLNDPSGPDYSVTITQQREPQFYRHGDGAE
jgi:hypothetical protein